jgi:4-hydroxybenzoyl-CoA thioesterase
VTYRSTVRVRFGHCDPAGIVFYPRYLEMFNHLVEDWCRQESLPFFEMKAGNGRGLPTVHLEVDFLAPSFMGDQLTATLSVREIGTSSIGLEIVLQGADGADRVRGRVVLVLMDALSKRSIAIPDDIRSRIAAYQGVST